MKIFRIFRILHSIKDDYFTESSDLSRQSKSTISTFFFSTRVITTEPFYINSIIQEKAWSKSQFCCRRWNNWCRKPYREVILDLALWIFTNSPVSNFQYLLWLDGLLLFSFYEYWPSILLNNNRKSKHCIQTFARLGGKFLIITWYFATIEKINHNLQHFFRYWLTQDFNFAATRIGSCILDHLA